MENYTKTARLGEGTYGVVYKAVHKSTEAVVAVKVMRVACDEGVPCTAIREISILKELSHPNIVQLQDVLLQDNKLCLVLEFLPMDLKTYLDFLPCGIILEPDLVQSYVYQVMLGIVFCHSRRIMHRDLKPENLLINEAGIIKIADFGLARTFAIPERVYTHEVTTLWYRAPEVLLGSPRYSAPVDIWATGAVMAELATRRPLFRGHSEINQLACIFRVLGTPSNEVWDKVETLPNFLPFFPKWEGGGLASSVKTLDPAGLDLLSKLLIYNPATRISAKQALLHPYFNSLNKASLPATLAASWPR